MKTISLLMANHPKLHYNPIFWKTFQLMLAQKLPIKRSQDIQYNDTEHNYIQYNNK